MFKVIGLDKSKLKIPMIDFASITYLPDTRSKSESNLLISFTNDFTLSIELKKYLLFSLEKTSLNFVLFYDYLKMDGHKSQEINCQRKLQHFRQIKHIYRKEKNMKKAALHNLGCKVNAYETEAMQQLLEENGYEIVPFKEGADVYIINTCTVTNMADRKSRQMLHRAKR